MLQSIQLFRQSLQYLDPRSPGDFADRLNHSLSVALLLLFSMLVSTKQYFGSAINCWVPAEFKDGWEQYTESYCLIQNTYFENRRMSGRENSVTIAYYQWVPFILAFQALLFVLPKMLWKALYRRTGIDLDLVLETAASVEYSLSIEPYPAAHQMRSLCKDLLQLMDQAKTNITLTVTYIAIKILNLLNVIGQWHLMNVFLGEFNPFWALVTLHNILTGNDWKQTGVFPRVTLCDFDVRVLGNLQFHTVQCALLINMLNEKIYIVLWFWFSILTVCNGLSLAYWLFASVAGPSRHNWVMKYLKIRGYDQQQTQNFFKDLMSVDGILILRFMQNCVGNTMCCRVVNGMIKLHETGQYKPKDFSGML